MFWTKKKAPKWRLLYVYHHDTTNWADTFSDDKMQTINPVPVPSDEDGIFPEIWLASGKYDVRVTDDKMVTLWNAQNLEVSERQLCLPLTKPQ